MNRLYTPTLLRRTAAAAAAVAAFLIADTAAAQTITLSTGSSCTYSSMSVNPSGNFTVTCSGAATPPTPGNAGTFALSGGALALLIGASSNATNQLTVTRSGGTTDAVDVAYTITSAATPSCNTIGSGTLTFNNGSSASLALPVTATGTAGACTVTLTGVVTNGAVTASTGPALGSLVSATVTVSAAPPPPPPGTCPTPPANMVTADLGWPGLTTRVALLSRQVVSFPAPPTWSGISNVIRIGETVTTPTGSFLEVALSKCPGVIDPTAAGYCYLSGYVTNLNELVYYYATGGGRGETWIAIQKACYAPLGDGVWYVNARWTYDFSPYGTGQYVFQWGHGPY